MMYDWDVQTGVTPLQLKRVLNDFDGAGYDVYNVILERPDSNWEEGLTYTIIARLPKFPVPSFLDDEDTE